jgi:hypothetical protein
VSTEGVPAVGHYKIDEEGYASTMEKEYQHVIPQGYLKVVSARFTTRPRGTNLGGSKS